MNLSSFDINPQYLGRIGVLRQKYHLDIEELMLIFFFASDKFGIKGKYL